MKPENPIHLHPRAKPFPDIEPRPSFMVKPLDTQKIYGDICARLKSERDAVKSFLPVIEGKV